MNYFLMSTISFMSNPFWQTYWGGKIKGYINNIALGLLLFIVGLFLVTIFVKISSKLLDHTKLDDTAQDFIEKLLSIGGKIFIVVIALSTAGLDVRPLIAGIGVAGFVIGFALKDTLSNISAGFMLLFYCPFKKGDFVEVLGGKVKGTVESIDIPASLFVTEEKKIVMVPNSRIWGDVIINHSRKLGE